MISDRLLELGFKELRGTEIDPDIDSIYQFGIISVAICKKMCRIFVDKILVQGVENEEQLIILSRAVNTQSHLV